MGDASLTTARRLLHLLMQRGATPATLLPDHIAEVYKTQRQLINRPDFCAIEKTADRLTETDAADGDSAIWAVIVETRPTEDLAFTVRTVHRELGLPIQIYHGRDNGAHVRHVLADLIDAGFVRLVELPISGLTKAAYNALLLSSAFWRSIPARNRVLIFQTDAIVCAGRDYELTDFADYDLVSAYWPARRPMGFVIHGGCGGFSLRNKELVLECLDRFPPTCWRAGEDDYFGFHIDLIGGRVAAPVACSMFATQHIYRHRSLGMHKITTLRDGDLRDFLGYCPQAVRLLPADTLRTR